MRLLPLAFTLSACLSGLPALAAPNFAVEEATIAGIHQAPFSQGTHYTDNDVVRMRNELTPELSSAGVDLVLSGHDHIYTRTHLMNGADPVVPEGAAKAGDVLIPDENQVL